MRESISNQLKTPKTLDEFHHRLQEIGILWSKAQTQLFLEMDKTIIQKGDKWQVEDGGKKDVILEIVDKVLGNRPIVPIKKIIDAISIDCKDITISGREILKISLDSGNYISPNGKAIKRKS